MEQGAKGGLVRCVVVGLGWMLARRRCHSRNVKVTQWGQGVWIEGGIEYEVGQRAVGVAQVRGERYCQWQGHESFGKRSSEKPW